jgi:sulfatase modifying factor 1
MLPTRQQVTDFHRVATAIFAIAIAGFAMRSTRAVTIDMVLVGDAGNVADASGYGAVAYQYRIGKYEVTIGQYTEFLNAVAATDPYGLYHAWHGSDQTSGGIVRAGSSGAYTYTVTGPFGAAPAGADSPANRPITLVSWFDAARFANWVANGQPTGAAGPTTTENGAYALNGATSGLAQAANPVNPNTGEVPLYRLPTENEWYKAAYYMGGSANAGYWNYATQSDTAPGNALNGGPNMANYLANGVHSVTQSSEFSLSQNYVTNAGAFSASPSSYGTFDQSGNVWEWNDISGTGGSSRGRRGGDWTDTAFGLGSSISYMESTSQEVTTGGFRLAGPVAVPEPSSCAMALGGLCYGGYLAWRHRKRADSAVQIRLSEMHRIGDRR